MSNFDEKHSYEALLDSLRATYDMRKDKFKERMHLMSKEDKVIEQHLFRLEGDALTRSDNYVKRDVLFNFDDFMPDMGISEALDSSESMRRMCGDHVGAIAERKHVCPKPGCNKSYTSSHGLKYHLNHGHNKDKENIYKPFVCTVQDCGKSYRNSNGLKYHMTKVHNIDK